MDGPRNGVEGIAKWDGKGHGYGKVQELSPWFQGSIWLPAIEIPLWGRNQPILTLSCKVWYKACCCCYGYLCLGICKRKGMNGALQWIKGGRICFTSLKVGSLSPSSWIWVRSGGLWSVEYNENQPLSALWDKPFRIRWLSCPPETVHSFRRQSLRGEKLQLFGEAVW